MLQRAVFDIWSQNHSSFESLLYMGTVVKGVAVAAFSYQLTAWILLPQCAELKGRLNEAYWNALKSRVYILPYTFGRLWGATV